MRRVHIAEAQNCRRLAPAKERAPSVSPPCWWRVEDVGETADIIGLRLSYELASQFRLY